MAAWGKKKMIGSLVRRPMGNERSLLGQNVYEQREETSLFCLSRRNLGRWRLESDQHLSFLGLLPRGKGSS